MAYILKLIVNMALLFVLVYALAVDAKDAVYVAVWCVFISLPVYTYTLWLEYCELRLKEARERHLVYALVDGEHLHIDELSEFKIPAYRRYWYLPSRLAVIKAREDVNRDTFAVLAGLDTVDTQC